MEKFQKNKISLLEAVRETIVEYMGEEKINVFSEIADKRRKRRIKLMLRELDKLIDEMVIEEKLKQQERIYNKKQMEEATRHAIQRYND